MSPDGVPHWSNVLRSPSCLFSHLFWCCKFVWLLRSDPVARNCLNHLKMSNFDVKFSKLYFAWISPAPFGTILTQTMKWHKNFLFIGIFHSFKDRKLLWSHLVKSEKEWEKHWNWHSYTRWCGLTVLWDTLYMNKINVTILTNSSKM